MRQALQYVSVGLLWTSVGVLMGFAAVGQGAWITLLGVAAFLLLAEIAWIVSRAAFLSERADVDVGVRSNARALIALAARAEMCRAGLHGRDVQGRCVHCDPDVIRSRWPQWEVAMRDGSRHTVQEPTEQAARSHVVYGAEPSLRFPKNQRARAFVWDGEGEALGAVRVHPSQIVSVRRVEPGGAS